MVVAMKEGLRSLFVSDMDERLVRKWGLEFEIIASAIRQQGKLTDDLQLRFRESHLLLVDMIYWRC